MTDQQEKVDAIVAELRSAAEKATPGHWLNTEVIRPHRTGDMYADSGWSTEFVGYEILGQDDAVVHDATSGVEREEDIEFIALANPANVLTLLAALTSEREENERWQNRWVEDAHIEKGGVPFPVIPEYRAALARAAAAEAKVKELVEALEKAREYVQDHMDAQPNDETRTDLAMIDAAILSAKGV